VRRPKRNASAICQTVAVAAVVKVCGPAADARRCLCTKCTSASGHDTLLGAANTHDSVQGSSRTAGMYVGAFELSSTLVQDHSIAQDSSIARLHGCVNAIVVVDVPAAATTWRAEAAVGIAHLHTSTGCTSVSAFVVPAPFSAVYVIVTLVFSTSCLDELVDGGSRTSISISVATVSPDGPLLSRRTILAARVSSLFRSVRHCGTPSAIRSTPPSHVLHSTVAVADGSEAVAEAIATRSENDVFPKVGYRTVATASRSCGAAAVTTTGTPKLFEAAVAST
jgi:hypothetical protein